MSLHAQEVPPVPEETRRVAHAAFPHGKVDRRMRDDLGTISTDHLLVHRFPARGQPAAAPWRLALTTVRPFAEGLSDRQACTQAKDAPRQRTVRPRAFHGRSPPRSQPTTPGGLGLRARTRRVSDAVVCAGRGTAGGPRPIGSNSSPRWPSMWPGWARGGWARPRPKPAGLPLRPCGWQPPRVAAPLNSPPGSILTWCSVVTSSNDWRTSCRLSGPRPHGALRP